MLFPILGAHVSGSEFQYPDLTWKELCGQMANLVAESGGNKGQLSLLVEAITRQFRVLDKMECEKLVICLKHLDNRLIRLVDRWGLIVYNNCQTKRPVVLITAGRVLSVNKISILTTNN
jgi:hypothetical protein